jgi:predicted nucleotidyltransferase
MAESRDPAPNALAAQPRAVLSPTVEAALARFRGAMVATFGARLRELVLFGSWARGDADAESDVDVLVVVDGLDERERRLVFDASYDAARAATKADDDWVSISPLAYSTQQADEMRSRERRLFRDIAAEGVAL